MDILGIGPMELILILIVALAVFGPDKLPTIGAKLGKAMRDMRRATRSFSEEIGAPAREIMEPIKEVSGAVKSVGEVATVARNPGEAIRQSMLKELKGATEAPLEPSEPENRIAPPAITDQEATTGEDVAATPEAPASASAPAALPPLVPAEPDTGESTPADPVEETPPSDPDAKS